MLFFSTQSLALMLSAISTFQVGMVHGASSLPSLYNWKNRNCTSAVLYCPNTSPLPNCCATNGRRILGGTATGITGTQFHILFTSDRYLKCSKALVASNSNYCIAATNAQGHAWCQLCNGMKAKRALAEVFGTPLMSRNESHTEEIDNIEDDENEGDCDVTTRMTKDGVHYFRFNEPDQPEDHSEALADWWESDLSEDEMPEHLRQYAVEPEEHDRLHIQERMAGGGEIVASEK